MLLAVAMALDPGSALAVSYLGSFGTVNSGPYSIMNPVGLALASDGTLWVALNSLERAKHFSSLGVYLGETSAPVASPTGVAVLSTGELVVSGRFGVYRFQPDGTGMTDLGLGPAYALVADASGGFWATSRFPHRVFAWPSAAGVSLPWVPAGFDRAPDGTLYVANTTQNRIDVFGGPAPAFSFGSLGSGSGMFSAPADVRIWNGLVFVTDSGNHRVQVFRSDGTYVSQFGTAGTAPGQLLKPAGIVVSPDGVIFVAELGNNRISRFGDIATPATATSWGRIKSLFR